MTESNGTTTRVHLLVWNLQVLLAVDSHAGKRLVELNDIAVVERDLELGEQLWNRDGWADTHDSGRETGDSGADELGYDWLLELESLAALHEEYGGGSIGDLGRVTASAAVTAEVLEGWADLAETLVCGAPSWTLVLGQSD